MAPRAPTTPPERTRTIRQEIRAQLGGGPLTALELSQLVSVKERDIAGHLEHIQRSCKQGPARFLVVPARCRTCDYEFADRRKLTRPGACPACRGQRIEPALFEVVGGAGQESGS